MIFRKNETKLPNFKSTEKMAPGLSLATSISHHKPTKTNNPWYS